MHKPKPYAPDLFYPRNRAERRKARRDGYPVRPPWSFPMVVLGLPEKSL